MPTNMEADSLPAAFHSMGSEAWGGGGRWRCYRGEETMTIFVPATILWA